LREIQARDARATSPNCAGFPFLRFIQLVDYHVDSRSINSSFPAVRQI